MTYVLRCWGVYRAPPGISPRYTAKHKAMTYPTWEAAAAVAAPTDTIESHTASVWSCPQDTQCFGKDEQEGIDPMEFLYYGSNT